MTSYFIMVDSIRRHFPEQFNKPLLGPFLTSGVCSKASSGIQNLLHFYVLEYFYECYAVHHASTCVHVCVKWESTPSVSITLAAMVRPYHITGSGSKNKNSNRF